MDDIDRLMDMAVLEATQFYREEEMRRMKRKEEWGRIMARLAAAQRRTEQSMQDHIESLRRNRGAC